MKKTRRMLALVIAMLIILTGCISAFAEEDVTLTILTRYSGSDPHTPWLEWCIEEFTKEHPNVTIQNESIADEAAYNNKLKTCIASGNIPDQWMMYGAATVVEYAKNGLVMDISDWKNDEVWVSGFLDPELSTYNLSGYGVDGIYGLSIAMVPEIIYYNVDLFEKAGIEKVPETLSELYEAIEKLKAIDVTPISMGASDTWRLGHFFDCLVYRMCGIDKIKDIGARNAKWTDPEVIEALKELKNFKDVGAFEPNFEGVDWSMESAGFLAGKYAMCVVPTWFIATIENSDTEQNIAFFEFPYDEDHPEYADNAAVFSDGQLFSNKVEGYKREVLTEWGKFISSAKAESARIRIARGMPGRTDIEVDVSAMSDMQVKGIELTKNLTRFAGDTFDFDMLNSMQDVTRNNLVGMMLGMSPEDTAAAIQAEIDNYA